MNKETAEALLLNIDNQIHKIQLDLRSNKREINRIAKIQRVHKTMIGKLFKLRKSIVNEPK